MKENKRKKGGKLVCIGHPTDPLCLTIRKVPKQKTQDDARENDLKPIGMKRPHLIFRKFHDVPDKNDTGLETKLPAVGE